MILFWHTSPTCSPCKVLLPFVKKILDGHPTIKLQTIDVQEDPDQVFLPDLTSVPTIALMNEGRLLARLDGPMVSRQTIRKLVEDHS